MSDRRKASRDSCYSYRIIPRKCNHCGNVSSESIVIFDAEDDPLNPKYSGTFQLDVLREGGGRRMHSLLCDNFYDFMRESGVQLAKDVGAKKVVAEMTESHVRLMAYHMRKVAKVTCDLDTPAMDKDGMPLIYDGQYLYRVEIVF